MTALAEQLQDEEDALGPVQRWIEKTLNATVSDLVRGEHTREAAERLSIANAFGSLRTIARIDFSRRFEAGARSNPNYGGIRPESMRRVIFPPATCAAEPWSGSRAERNGGARGRPARRSTCRSRKLQRQGRPSITSRVLFAGGRGHGTGDRSGGADPAPNAVDAITPPARDAFLCRRHRCHHGLSLGPGPQVRVGRRGAPTGLADHPRRAGAIPSQRAQHPDHQQSGGRLVSSRSAAEVEFAGGDCARGRHPGGRADDAVERRGREAGA